MRQKRPTWGDVAWMFLVGGLFGYGFGAPGPGPAWMSSAFEHWLWPMITGMYALVAVILLWPLVSSARWRWHRLRHE